MIRQTTNTLESTAQGMNPDIKVPQNRGVQGTINPVNPRGRLHDLPDHRSSRHVGLMQLSQAAEFIAPVPSDPARTSTCFATSDIDSILQIDLEIEVTKNVNSRPVKASNFAGNGAHMSDLLITRSSRINVHTDQL